VTDALGHTTQFTQYDGNGRLLEQVDPNGVTTDYAYTSRGWLSTVTVTPSGGGATLVTSYTYDGVGQLQQTTLPDGTYVKYSYDAAHRLTQITDSAGDTVNYTLDAIGNRQAEKWDDPAGVLRRNIARAYDALNRLQTVTGATQ
jgi:YD repeat-containing protein